VLNGGAAAAGIPAGKAVDRIGERLILAYGTIASGIIIMGVNAVSNLTGLLAVLLLVGFITTTTVPAGSKVVARWFSERERGITDYARERRRELPRRARMCRRSCH
jgi:sugar phosphate permease